MPDDSACHSTAYSTLDHQVFLAKGRFLAGLFQPVEARAYMEELFHPAGLAESVVAVDGRKGSYRRFPTRLEAWQAACQQGDLFLSYCDFFGTPTKSHLKQCYGLCLDMDDVDATDLAVILEHVQQHNQRHPPSYLVNSGRGVHLLFALEAPFPCHTRNMCALQTVFQGLQSNLHLRDALGSFGRMDSTWIGQSFRMPGMRSKVGRPVEAYRCGPAYNINALAERFDVEIKAVDATEATMPGRRVPNIHTMPVGAGNPALIGWYNSTLDRARDETPRGTRYNALCAVAVIGIKAAVPREQVARHLRELARHWSRRDHAPVTLAEVDKALRMHAPRFLRVTRARLEEWLGFQFPGRQRSSRVTLRERLVQQVQQFQASGTPFSTSSLATALKVQPSQVSRLVHIKAGGRGVFWK